jgi:hypothetical protein
MAGSFFFSGGEVSMRKSHDGSTDHLDDGELLDRETHDRDEFKRLEAEEPQLRSTTYGPSRASTALVKAWERWWHTNAAARMRGLVSRTLGR